MKSVNILFSVAVLATTSILANPIIIDELKHNAGDVTSQAIPHNVDGQESIEHSIPETSKKRANCYAIDGSCYRAKRSLEEATDQHKRTVEEATAKAKRSADPAASNWCYTPGKPCYKLKRAAEAAAKAIAAPDPDPRKARPSWCYMPGETCFKAKRDELELVARAHQAVDEIAAAASKKRGAVEPSCFSPGQLCYKTKHKIIEARAALANAEINADPFAVVDDSLGTSLQAYCDSAHGPCEKIRRTARAIADALEERTASPEPDARKARPSWCYMPGETCFKAKRAIEEISALVMKV